MPTPLSLPYPPLVLIESDVPIEWDFLHGHLENRLESGVSICLVTKAGNPHRGGYFFHLKKTQEGIFLSTFERANVCHFKEEHDCAAFINHVAGLQYDVKMWRMSQIVNLRSDDDTK